MEYQGLESRESLIKTSYLSMGLYGLLTTALILFVNISNSNEKCGPVKILDTMIYTLIPIVLLQFLFMYLLQNYPGWKIPFSNTLGYGIASALAFMGILPNIKGTVENVFKKSTKSELLDDVMLNDHSFLLNYFTPSSFCEKIVEQKLEKRLNNTILPNLNGKETQMKGGGLSDESKKTYSKYIDNCMRDGNEFLKKLYLLVMVKDYISEALLLSLVGFLVITKSYNTIVNFKCAPVNVKNQEKKIKEVQDNLNK